MLPADIERNNSAHQVCRCCGCRTADSLETEQKAEELLLTMAAAPGNSKLHRQHQQSLPLALHCFSSGGHHLFAAALPS